MMSAQLQKKIKFFVTCDKYSEVTEQNLSVCILTHGIHKKVNKSNYRPEVPRGFQEVKVPRFHDNGTGLW